MIFKQAERQQALTATALSCFKGEVGIDPLGGCVLVLVLWVDGVAATRSMSLTCCRIWIIDPECRIFKSGRSPLGPLFDIARTETDVPDITYAIAYDSLDKMVANGGIPVGPYQ